MTPERLAQHEYLAHVIYRALAARESNPAFQQVLMELAGHEREHYQFWLTFTPQTHTSVSSLTVWFFVSLRKAFGLTFTAKLLERRAAEIKQESKDFFTSVKDPARQARIAAFIKQEDEDELRLLSHIREELVDFVGNIVLGLNDGLIELTGALTGFTFALNNHLSVALAGTITGVSAALSMAASAYMQARHDPERISEAKRAGVYTGVAYAVVVILLIFPFFVFSNVYIALATMFFCITLIILGISFYTSVLFDRHFLPQAREMAFFSLGVATIAFLVGLLFRTLTGISI